MKPEANKHTHPACDREEYYYAKNEDSPGGGQTL